MCFIKTKLYFIELDESENFSDYGKFIKFLSPKKQEQILKFRFDIDKKLSLFSDLFVRYSACNILNLSNADLSFDKNDYGKPYLLGFPNFHYNISHTKNAIVIGISDKPIGVDVEKIKFADLKIAERFFCDNELASILSNREPNTAFYKIWTKKEAYIKWDGKGLSLPLTSFDVTDCKLNKMFSSFEIGEYILSVCSETDFSESALEIYDKDSTVKFLSMLMQYFI